MKWLAFAVLGLLTLLSAASGLPGREARAAGDITISGRVVNGTDGGGPVEGLEVTLTADVGDPAPLTTLTDAAGGFAFQNVPSAASAAYVISVPYRGVPYSARLKAGDDTSQPLAVLVYETTTSTEALTLLLDHHIAEVSPEEKRVSIVNYLEPVNGSDRTIVAGGRAFLFPPADGAEKLEVLEGPSSLSGADPAAGLLRAVPPGEHKLLLAYELPYKDEPLLFRKPVMYPTARAVFLLSQEDGRAESAQLPVATEVTNASGGFRLLSADDLAPGSTLQVTLSQFPGTEPNSKSMMWLVLPVTLGLLIAGTAVALFLRRRRRLEEAVAQ